MVSGSSLCNLFRLIVFFSSLDLAMCLPSDRSVCRSGRCHGDGLALGIVATAYTIGEVALRGARLLSKWVTAYWSPKYRQTWPINVHINSHFAIRSRGTLKLVATLAFLIRIRGEFDRLMSAAVLNLLLTFHIKLQATVRQINAQNESKATISFYDISLSPDHFVLCDRLQISWKKVYRCQNYRKSK